AEVRPAAVPGRVCRVPTGRAAGPRRRPARRGAAERVGAELLVLHRVDEAGRPHDVGSRGPRRGPVRGGCPLHLPTGGGGIGGGAAGGRVEGAGPPGGGARPAVAGQGAGPRPAAGGVVRQGLPPLVAGGRGTAGREGYADLAGDAGGRRPRGRRARSRTGAPKVGRSACGPAGGGEPGGAPGGPAPPRPPRP